MKSFILIFLLSLLNGSFAYAATKEELAESSQWKNLLHYRDSWLGSSYSAASLDNFFVSVNGRNSPLEELTESIKRLSSKHNSQRFICRFPARSLFINEYLNLKKDLNLALCKDYQRLKKITKAVGVSLVFTAYHTDAPASTYGHTLLRLEKESSRPNSKKSALLDFGVNYAAIADDKNPIIYALKGLFGYYDGQTSITPFFYKIREYSDYESRDLWTYHLNLNKEEIERLEAHLFELEDVGFPYYYMTANCSEFMIKLLDIARPGLQLKDELDITTIPSETVKVLFKKNLVKSVDFRPSGRRKYLASKAQLNHDEIDIFRNIVTAKTFDKLKTQPSMSSAKILDVTMDFIDFKHSAEILRETGAISGFKKTVLLQRSNVPLRGIDYQTKTPRAERPDLSHAPSKITLGMGNENYMGKFLSLSYRHNLHDTLDPAAGYSPDLSILFLETTGRFYTEKEILELNKIDLLRVSLLRDIDFDNLKPSGQVAMGIKRVTAMSDLSPYVQISGGLAKDIKLPAGIRNKLYLGMTSSLYGKDYNDESSIGVGGHALFIARLQMNTMFSFEYKKSQVMNLEEQWTRNEYQAEFRHYIRKNFGGVISLSRIDNGPVERSITSSFAFLYYF